MAGWTDADIAALRAAIASGARSVAYQDRSVTYHSLEDMIKLLAIMEADAAGGAGSDSSKGRSTLATFYRD